MLYSLVRLKKRQKQNSSLFRFLHEVRVLWGYNIFIFNIHRLLHRFRAISRKIYSRIFLLFVFELSYKYHRTFACTKIHSHIWCLVVTRYQLCTVYRFLSFWVSHTYKKYKDVVVRSCNFMKSFARKIEIFTLWLSICSPLIWTY